MMHEKIPKVTKSILSILFFARNAQKLLKTCCHVSGYMCLPSSLIVTKNYPMCTEF